MKKLSSTVLMFFFFIHINHNVVLAQDTLSISSQIAEQIEEIKKFEPTEMDDLKDYQKLLQHFIIEILEIEKANLQTNQNIDPNITDFHSHTSKDDLNLLRSYKKSLYLLERITKEKNVSLNKILISHQALINKYDQDEKAKQEDQTFWNLFNDFFTGPTGILLTLTVTVSVVYFFWDHVINFLGYTAQHSSEKSQSQNLPSDNFSYTSGKDEDIPIEIGDTLDQDQADLLGYTPLIKASSEGDINKVEQLLKKVNEKVINQKCKSGRTAFTMAAFKGHSSIVKMLLNHPQVTKKTLHSRDNIHYTALMWASYYGHKDVVQEILNSNHFSFDLMIMTGNDGRTAQMLAFENGHQDIVKLLNEKMPPIKLSSKGWSINIIQEEMARKNTYNLLRAKDSKGMTALMWTVYYNYPSVLNQLLNDFHMSEDVLSAQNKDGHTSFMLAILQNNNDYVKKFLNNKYMTIKIFNLSQKKKVTPLMMASFLGHINIVKSMLKSKHMTKEALAMRDDKGNTPLLLATAMGNRPIVKLLLDSQHMTEKIFGQQDLKGNTPLILTVTKNQNQLSILFYLLRARFMSTEYINKQNTVGDTALNLASYLGLYSFVLHLLDSGYIDQKGLYLTNNDGADPFIYAFEGNHMNILYLLEETRNRLLK